VCGRYSLAIPDPGSLRARFPIGEAIEVRTRYNVAPGDEVLAVTTDREGHPRGDMLRWGLVPSWAKSPDTGLKMINARLETVTEKPAFRRAFERFRCLIVADGFYEWRRAAGPTGSPKQPFHITRVDGQVFAFAGLWSIWHAEDGTRRSRRCMTACPSSSTRAPSPRGWTTPPRARSCTRSSAVSRPT
jgi:putative SOS response-associated peptidase YedK